MIGSLIVIVIKVHRYSFCIACIMRRVDSTMYKMGLKLGIMHEFILYVLNLATGIVSNLFNLSKSSEVLNHAESSMKK